MPDILVTNVTHTEVVGSQRKIAPKSGTERVVTLTFGDGALTYPVGGVPLDKAKLGCPTEVNELEVLSRTPAAANPFWEWDGSATSPKLIGYEVNAAGAGDEQFIQLDAADAPVAQTLKVKVRGY